MEERQVTVDGVTHPVPRPFVVDRHPEPDRAWTGTYPLPEAQLDRFLLKMSMGYPDRAAEAEIVLARHGGRTRDRSIRCSTPADIERMVAISSSRAHRPPARAATPCRLVAGHPSDPRPAPRRQPAGLARAAARGPDARRRGRPRATSSPTTSSASPCRCWPTAWSWRRPPSSAASPPSA